LNLRLAKASPAFEYARAQSDIDHPLAKPKHPEPTGRSTE
jgi:hypothetical protein